MRYHRNPLRLIRNYAVYYGKNNIQALSRFDCVITDPESLSVKEIATLRENGTLVIAYVSIGEVNANSPWWDNIQERDNTWIIGKNPNWNSYYIDVSRKGWHDFILKTVIPDILQKAFDGFFLDTVDTVDVYPDKKAEMVALIKRIKKKYPLKILIQNRGFSVLRWTAGSIDGLLFESMSGTYDFAEKKYKKVVSNPYIKTVYQTAQEAGIEVLTLDYALERDTDIINWSMAQAAKYDFIPYISTIDLKSVYFHTIGPDKN